MHIDRMKTLIARHMGTAKDDAVDAVYVTMANDIARNAVQDHIRQHGWKMPSILVVIGLLSLIGALLMGQQLQDDQQQIARLNKEVTDVRRANETIIATFAPTHKADQDAACVGWLFKSNMAQARERMCKGR